ALAGVWPAAHNRGVFENRLRRKRALHIVRIHGTVRGPHHLLSLSHPARNKPWSGRVGARFAKCSDHACGRGCLNMPTVWFVLVAIMLTAYVVLDGFDLGAGIIHLLVAKGDREKRLVLRSIGPVWDGNEVWLLAGGGTLFFAFPLLYASSFSGFYLPLNIVLWLLILRAIGIEFRLHLENRIWREFFGGWFSIGSALLTIFYGAALGNVIRGVPLDKDGYFFAPLWTNFKVGHEPGILDWYTVIAGL